ncbi:MAG: hypothetical protein ACQEXX_20025 [Bacillota bacterium]
MPEKSGMFDTVEGDVREYNQGDFAEYFSRFITSGVFNGGLNLEVTATGTDANVRLNTGFAWINGFVYKVYDQPLVLGVQPASTQDRIDRIILRLDPSTPVRAIRAIVLQGAPNVNPTPPALVRSGSIYDLSLAQVRVVANSTLIEPENITDERLNETVCGLVNSLIRVDTDTFQRQWDAFMKSLENQGFATNQYVNSKFNTVVENYIRYPGYAETSQSSTPTEYIVSLDPHPPSLPDGFGITIVPNVDSGVSPTLKINSLPAVPLKKHDGSPMEMKAGKPYTFRKKGTDFLADSAGGGVKRVQRGVATILTQGGTDPTPTYVEVKINEVDLNKSVLKFEFSGGSSYPEYNYTRGELIDSTTIRFTRTKNDSQNVVRIVFEVIEFENVKSLRRGTKAMNSSLLNIPLNPPVDLSKSFVFASFNSNTQSPINNTLGNIRPQLDKENNLSIELAIGGTGATVAYQVVEFS